MPFNITESDRRAFDCSAMKDGLITLEEFTAQRVQEKIVSAQASREYEKRLKMTKLQLVDSVRNLTWTKYECVRRTIVIDGASVMAKNDTSISSLLSITRFFVSRQFEVLLVLPKSFQKFHGVPELDKADFCVFVAGTPIQTGQLAFEFAAQTNGIVVYSGSGSLSPSEHSSFKIEWTASKCGHMRTKFSDYIARKQFSFKNQSGEKMSEENVISKVYAFPSQLQYRISKERREMAYSEEKKIKTLALLDQLIVDVLNRKYSKKTEDTPRISPEQAPALQIAKEEEDEW